MGVEIGAEGGEQLQDDVAAAGDAGEAGLVVARLEPLAGARHALDAGRAAAQGSHRAVDLAVAMELPAARRAGVDVALDAMYGAGLGVSRRGGDEVDFDLQTALRFTRHRGCSVVVGASA